MSGILVGEALWGSPAHAEPGALCRNPPNLACAEPSRTAAFSPGVPVLSLETQVTTRAAFSVRPPSSRPRHFPLVWGPPALGCGEVIVTSLWRCFDLLFIEKDFLSWENGNYVLNFELNQVFGSYESWNFIKINDLGGVEYLLTRCYQSSNI